MKKVFQELFLQIPLYQLSFETTVPKSLLYYEEIVHAVPETMLEKQAILVLEKDKEARKLNQFEIASQIIQNPNIAGIIIDSAIFPELSEDIRLLYNECQMPIVKVANLSSVSNLIEQQEAWTFVNMSKELSGMMDKGFTEVCSELAAAFDTAFLYLNEEYEIIWQAGNEEILRTAQRWINANKRRLSFGQAFQQAEDDEFQIYPVHIGEVIEQSLVVPTNLADWQKNIVDKLVGLTALLLQTEGMFREHEAKMMEHFIYDLLYHKFESQKVMIKQGKSWGWNLEIPHHLILMNVELSDELNTDIDWLEKMVFLISELREALGEQMIVFPFQDQIVVLLEDGENRTKRERYEYVMQLVKTVKNVISEHWPKEEVIFGIGKWYKNTTFLNKSYQEAKQAIRFGKIWFEDRDIFHIDDLGIMRILVHSHQEILNDYCDEYLSILIESDNELGTDYLNTIRAYIKHQGRINEVSDALFVHPNTLRYRLKKIEELTGVDLQDLEQSVNLIIALKLNSVRKL